MIKRLLRINSCILLVILLSILAWSSLSLFSLSYSCILIAFPGHSSIRERKEKEGKERKGKKKSNKEDLDPVATMGLLYRY